MERSTAFTGDAALKSRYVRHMFGRIAGRYDRMNGVMTLGRHGAWRRLAARAADPLPGNPALDLCCGTGDMALELAQLGRGPVVAVDFSAPMLDVARSKVRDAGAERAIWFHEADALRLPFKDASFSCVATAFSLRNVGSIPAFISEMCRVAVPGGRVVTLDLLGAPPGILSPFARLYLRYVVPALGRLLAGDADAYAYLPASTGFVPSADDLARLMEEVGLTRVSYQRLALGSVAVHVGERPR